MFALYEENYYIKKIVVILLWQCPVTPRLLPEGISAYFFYLIDRKSKACNDGVSKLYFELSVRKKICK